MPRTGEQVQLAGIYRGVCEKRGHIEQGKFFNNGPNDRFTPCSEGECHAGGHGMMGSLGALAGSGSAMNWTWVRAR